MASGTLTQVEAAGLAHRSPLDAVATEAQLLALVLALLPAHTPLSESENALARSVLPTKETTLIRAARDAIEAGHEPLGALFCRVRSPEVRRGQGAIYTPDSIVSSMIAWAANQTPFARVIDPGAGSGRFLIAAALAWKSTELIAVESDPLAALILRANLEQLRLTERARVVVADYRDFEPTPANGATLFIGNPPYVRHHQISPHWKAWYVRVTERLATRGSQLAGLHLHFFFKTLELARKGDFGCFVTASEWLDVNYGEALRRALLEDLGGESLHVLDPRAMPFADAITTAAITCFAIGRKPKHFRVRYLGSAKALGDLTSGERVAREELESAARWSIIVRKTPKAPAGYVRVGDLFAVHRGQVTGANEIWIAGEHARELPRRFLFPAITKARELIAAAPELADLSGLRRVIDLPTDLGGLDPTTRTAVDRFLRWARGRGANQAYIARHRPAWWSVGLFEPAPILCTYMGRRPPVFVRNLCGARHLNISHGLYPREPLSEATLKAIVAWLQDNVHVGYGRTYAGGLTKFEPREVERIPIPRPESLRT